MTASDGKSAKRGSRGAATKAPRPRGGGLKALASRLPAITRRAGARRGFADAALLSDWPRIVGTEIAANSEPLKLTFARPRERSAGTLTLKVSPGFALALQHLEPQLLERINGHFGYRAIARLRFKQGPLSRPARPETPFKTPAETPPAPSLDAATDAAIRARVADISDPVLAAALARLARGIATRNRP